MPSKRGASSADLCQKQLNFSTKNAIINNCPKDNTSRNKYSRRQTGILWNTFKNLYFKIFMKIKTIQRSTEWVGRCNFMKMSILLNSICRQNTLPIFQGLLACMQGAHDHSKVCMGKGLKEPTVFLREEVEGISVVTDKDLLECQGSTSCDVDKKNKWSNGFS